MAARYLRHLLRAGRPAEAAAFAETWRDRDPGNLTHALSLGRLAADRRSALAVARGRRAPDRRSTISATGCPRSTRSPSGCAASILRSTSRSNSRCAAAPRPTGPCSAGSSRRSRRLRALIVEAVERHVAQLPPPAPGHPHLARQARADPLRRLLVGAADRRGLPRQPRPPRRLVQLGLLRRPARGGDGRRGPCRLAVARRAAGELGLDLPPIRLIEPRPGRLVLFPSTMWHGTRPFARASG